MIFLGDIRDDQLRTRVGTYRVLIVDPPWGYENQAPGSSAEVYSTLHDDEIVDLNLQDFAADDAVLLLWTTWAKLTISLKALEAWDFKYVTGFPWVKLTTTGNGIAYGLGFWARGCSEPILVGRRGLARPPLESQWLGLISPNFPHSRKPESLHVYAESLPGPYLEVFARRSRPGWDCIGLEVDDEKVPAVPSLLTIEEFKLGDKFYTSKSLSIYHILFITHDGKILLKDEKTPYTRWTKPATLRKFYSRMIGRSK